MQADGPDNQQHVSLQQNVKGVLKVQCITAVLILLLVTIYSLLGGESTSVLSNRLLASLYGASLAIIGSVLSARSIRRASPQNDEKPIPGASPVSLVPIFSGLLNKLVIVGGGIGFGLIVLGLDPILVVTGYLVVQISAATQLILGGTQN